MVRSNINIIKVLIALMLSALTACGGGDSGDKKEDKLIDDKPVPTQPQNVSALAGYTQVTLSWDDVNDATGYDICSATEAISQPANCSIHQNGALAVDQTSPAVISSLTNSTQYFFVVIPKNTNGDGAASAVVNATPAGVAVPAPTGKLNDTGITLCGDYAFGSNGTANGNDHNNDLDCQLATDGEGDLIPSGQDAISGRDVNAATNSDSDGHKGFSFTKLDSDGFVLSEQSVTTFSCVKDDVTSLIWEVKQTAPGLHNKDDVYTWYNSNAATNGGGDGATIDNISVCEGKPSNTCNTQTYVSRVNAAGLCGANDWRLPTRKELRSIVHYGRPPPAIDISYFPNVNGGRYWSSSPYAPNSIGAWVVDFNNGKSFVFTKSVNIAHVRLVRSGQ